MSLLALRFEQSLVSYLAGEIQGLAIHAGHGNGDQTALPRMIVTVASGGGELVKSAGVDQLEVEIQILAASGEAGVRLASGDPVEQLATLADAVRGALQESALDAVESAIGGEYPSIAFSGLEYEGHKEGRDDQRALHGVVMNYRAWAGLVG